jgi:hypothetical protein
MDYSYSLQIAIKNYLTKSKSVPVDWRGIYGSLDRGGVVVAIFSLFKAT